MIQVSEGRLAISYPLAQGLTTKLLGFPFGLGNFNHRRATSPGISKSPYFLVPSKLVFEFCVSGLASVQHAEFVEAEQEALVRLLRRLVRLGFCSLAGASLNDGLGGLPFLQ